MKLMSMSVWFNNYDFENDGVPAKSYAGSVDFDLNGGRLVVKLSEEDVNRIIALISPQVVGACKDLGEVTPNVVRASTYQALTHEQ